MRGCGEGGGQRGRVKQSLKQVGLVFVLDQFIAWKRNSEQYGIQMQTKIYSVVSKYSLTYRIVLQTEYRCHIQCHNC